jgi:hypothetical protein
MCFSQGCLSLRSGRQHAQPNWDYRARNVDSASPSYFFLHFFTYAFRNAIQYLAANVHTIVSIIVPSVQLTVLFRRRIELNELYKDFISHCAVCK